MEGHGGRALGGFYDHSWFSDISCALDESVNTGGPTAMAGKVVEAQGKLAAGPSKEWRGQEKAAS